MKSNKDYYSINIINKEKEFVKTDIFSLLMQKSPTIVACYIMFDIQRYIYRFNQKTDEFPIWIEDLRKAQAEINILKKMELSFFQKFILKRVNRLFNNSEKGFAEFKILNQQITITQANILLYISKLDFDVALNEIKKTISKIQQARDKNLSITEILL